MRISNFHVRFYRSIINDCINISDFNVLIGKNNSGKSNIVTALFDYRDILLENKRPGEVYEEAISKQERPALQQSPYLRHNTSSERTITFSVTYETNHDERKYIYEYLYEEYDVDSHFIKNVVDEDWMGKIRHRLEIGTDGVVSDKFAFRFQDNWVLISAKETSDILNGFGSSTLSNIGQLRESIVTEESSERSIRIIDFDLFPSDNRLVNTGVEYSPGISIIIDPFDKIISEFLNEWSLVHAFREPVDQSPVKYQTNLEPSGRNLPQTLHTLSQNDKKTFNRIVKKYTEIMEGIDDIRTPLLPNTDTTIKVDETNIPEGIPLSEISAGSKDILILITKILSIRKSTSFVAIEEPELHLHPSAEKKVLDLVKEVAEDFDIQTVITTHSEVFVDSTSVEKIIRTERIDSITEFREVTTEEVPHELTDMGYDYSGLLQSDAVVFVEGLSDKLILKQLCETNGIDLKDSGIEIIELEGEGNIESDGRSLVKLLCRFQIPFLFIADSDGEESRKVKDHYLGKINRSGGDWCAKPNDFHIWNEYNIESYLIQAPQSIATVLNANEEVIIELIDKNEREDGAKVLDDLFQKELDRSYRKDTDGSVIAKQISSSETPKEVENVISKIESLVK